MITAGAGHAWTWRRGQRGAGEGLQSHQRGGHQASAAAGLLVGNGNDVDQVKQLDAGCVGINAHQEHAELLRFD